LVVKCHTLPPATQELCRAGAIRAIYTWRDPYDVVVSSHRMFNCSIEQSIALLQNSLRVWSFHLSTNSACIVSYETIVKHPAAGIARIAGYLDLSIDPKTLSRIEDEVSFEKLKRFTEHIEQFDPRRIVRKDGFVYDRETLLHQNHIKNGGFGYGVGCLDETQISSINAILLEEGFGYLRQGRESLLPIALECAG
jgi:hypothetical protein